MTNERPIATSTGLHLPTELLIDAVQEYAIFLLEPDGTVASWNAGARRIKGYEAADIVGQHFSLFYTADDVNAGKPGRQLETAATQGQCRDEGWRVRNDGTTFWANVVITALHGADGTLEGFVKITRDETDRKEADEHVRQLELLTDRERIAEGMRDSVVHRLFGAGLLLQGALRLIDDPQATDRVQTAIDMLDETLREVRAVVVDLER